MGLLTKKRKRMNHPDPKKHQTISFIKSAVRIISYVALPISLTVTAIGLILAEALGVIEEM